MSFPGGQRGVPRPAAAPDGGQAAWRALDVEIGPGHYHFAPQPPRTPMRFRRAAVMRGYETELGALGGGELTLTVHHKPASGQPPAADAELPHFDVDADGAVQPRAV
jgi:hypothetical protein